MRRQRICIIAPDLSSEASGISQYVIGLVKHLDVKRVEITVWTASFGIQLEGCKVRVFPFIKSFGRLYFSFRILLAFVFAAGRFDVMHVQGLWTFFFFGLYVIPPVRGLKKIVTLHGMLSSEALRKRKSAKYMLGPLTRWNLNCVDHVIVTSQKELEEALAYGISKDRLITIGIGVDFSTFSRHRTEPANYRSIRYLGRFDDIKGLDLMIEAWLSIPDHKGWQLELAGPESPYKEALRNLVSDCRGAHVVFHESKFGADKEAFISGGTVIALPSRSENFGIAILEGLAAAKPVLVSEFTPWGNLIDGKIGWVTDLSNNQLVKILEEILAQPDEILTQKGLRGFELARIRFDIKIMISEILKLYEVY